MRSDENIVEVPKRRIGRQWLLSEDVERRAGDVALLQNSDQDCLVNQRAPAYVDQVSVLAHVRQTLGVKEALGLGRQGRGQHNVMSAGEYCVEVFQAEDLMCDLASSLRMLPHRNDVHSQGRRAPG